MSPEYRERFPQFSYTGLTRKLVAMAKAYRKASARSKYIEDQIRKSALRDHTIRSLHET